MSDLRTAAQQALEALESAEFDPHSSDAVYKAITALRTALAEPVQEPVAWSHINGTSDTKWHPPQRKPLTEEEITQCFAGADIIDCSSGQLWVKVARAIERAHEIT